MTVYLDITERKQMEEALRIAAVAFESSQGMLITDATNVILRVNQAFCDITGYSAEETIGRTPRLAEHRRNNPALATVITGCIVQNGTWQGELWNRRKNGQVYPQWVVITAVKDEAGRITNYVTTLIDITERKQLEEQVRELAFYDPLTQLPNRRLLGDRLSQALAESKRNGRYGALMFLDLDNFKTLNDKHGHAVGDLLLIEAAKRMKNCVREVDTVARYGGDEFVVVMDDLNEDKAASTAQASSVAEKIRAALAEPYLLAIKHGASAGTLVEHRCTASLGVLVFIDREGTQDDFLRLADTAMYQAKNAGSNLIRFFEVGG